MYMMYNCVLAQWSNPAAMWDTLRGGNNLCDGAVDAAALPAVMARVALVMSGGTEGGLSPHFLVLAVREVAQPVAVERHHAGLGDREEAGHQQQHEQRHE
jgi:hypothetical protein